MEGSAARKASPMDHPIRPVPIIVTFIDIILVEISREMYSYRVENTSSSHGIQQRL